MSDDEIKIVDYTEKQMLRYRGKNKDIKVSYLKCTKEEAENLIIDKIIKCTEKIGGKCKITMKQQ